MTLLVAGFAVANDNKTFFVSKANTSPEKKARFLKLWHAVQNPRFNPGTVRKSFLITQAVGKVGDRQRYLTREEAVLLKDPNLHENSVVEAWVVPDGVYDFNTVGRGTRRVPQFAEAVETADPDAPSEKEFVTELKAGKTFTVTVLVDRGCKLCFGDGKLNALSGERACPDCQGTGEVLETWTLKW